MSTRVLRCAIEEVADWYPCFFLDPHIAAFVAVTGQYSKPPAPFAVEAENVRSRWFKDAKQLTLQVSWSEETIDKAERLRATIQQKPMVELASVAVGLVLAHQVLTLARLEVTDYGERVDFRSPSARCVLEISGTESNAALSRRHKEKVAQALANPFGWDAAVVVCAFSEEGHRVRLSRHLFEESVHGKAKG